MNEGINRVERKRRRTIGLKEGKKGGKENREGNKELPGDETKGLKN